MIKFRSNICVLLGDTHSLERTFHIIQRKPNLDNLDIIFLGDGGEGFSGREHDEVYLKRISDECKKRNIFLYVIRGNHSNPEVWRRGYYFDNLLLVQDYTEAKFPNGKTALLVGGGLSIDRFYRKQGLDYWKDEVTVYKKTNKSYDFFFAHDCPDYFNHSTDSLRTSPHAAFLKDDKNLYQDALNQRNTIGRIVKDIYDFKPLYCFSGHFHNSICEEKKGGIKYRCLDIEEMILLDTENP